MRRVKTLHGLMHISRNALSLSSNKQTKGRGLGFGKGLAVYARNLTYQVSGKKKKKLLSARGGGVGGWERGGRFEARIHAVYSGGACVRIARWDIHVHVHTCTDTCTYEKVTLTKIGISRVTLDRK